MPRASQSIVYKNLAGICAGIRGPGRVAKVSQVVVANGFNNLASFAISLHAARELGPEQFGQVGLVLAIVSVGVVFLDSGVSIALVREYNTDADRERLALLVGGVLKAKLLQVILLAALAYPLAHLLRYFLPVLNNPDILTAGIVSAALLSLWTSVRSLEQARRDYSTFTRYIYLFGGLRFGVYGITLVLGKITPMSVILCLYLVPLALLLFYTVVLRERTALRIHRIDLAPEARALWAAARYGSWVAGATLFLSLFSRVPLLVLARRSTARELGLYSAALTFVAGFGLIWDAISTVIVPEVSALQTAQARLRFRALLLNKLFLMFTILASAVGACMFAQGFLLGPAYQGSVAIFFILGSSTAVCMCISVNNNLVHAYGIPQTMTYMNLGRLILLGCVVCLWPHPNAINVAIIWGLTMLAGDTGLYLYISRRISADRASLAVAITG